MAVNKDVFSPLFKNAPGINLSDEVSLTPVKYAENYLDQLNKRRIQLIPQLELARSALHDKKQQKKAAEEELKSLEVELAAAQATIQARQARVESKQLEISDATLQLETLKTNEAMERDRFINVMQELNTSILRVHNELQKSVVCRKCGTSSEG